MVTDCIWFDHKVKSRKKAWIHLILATTSAAENSDDKWYVGYVTILILSTTLGEKIYKLDTMLQCVQISVQTHKTNLKKINIKISLEKLKALFYNITRWKAINFILKLYIININIDYKWKPQIPAMLILANGLRTYNILAENALNINRPT